MRLAFALKQLQLDFKCEHNTNQVNIGKSSLSLFCIKTHSPKLITNLVCVCVSLCWRQLLSPTHHHQQQLSSLRSAAADCCCCCCQQQLFVCKKVSDFRIWHLYDQSLSAILLLFFLLLLQKSSSTFYKRCKVIGTFGVESIARLSH